MYYGNVTENGTAGMMVMTMTATDYDDLDEGTNAKLKYSIGRSSQRKIIRCNMHFFLLLNIEGSQHVENLKK